MDLTTSYEQAVPDEVRSRYEWCETRHAAAILRSTNPDAFAEMVGVLENFKLTAEDITEPGGNKSTVAAGLDLDFRKLGWREGQVDTMFRLSLKLMPWKPANEKAPVVHETESESKGYKVDNVKDRSVLDVEWNAKDGNLDRDLGAYRALYDTGLIDGAVIVTRSFESIRDLSARLGRLGGFSSSTTTTLDKLLPKLARGDGGGCPILAIAITERCYAP